MKALRELMSEGRIARAREARGWIARPGDIVDALAREGFAEFKTDATRTGRNRAPTGGLWQGLDLRTGAVASAIWFRAEDDERAVVFVDIDGRPFDETDDPDRNVA